MTEIVSLPLTICAREECEERFCPENRVHRFCSTSCRKREENKRYRKRHADKIRATKRAYQNHRYRSDPEYRAKEVARSRERSDPVKRAVWNAAWRAANYEYDLARKREWKRGRAAERAV